MIDATITVGNIIEIITIAGGGLIAIVTVRNSVNNLKDDLHGMKTDFIDMKSEIKELGNVVTKMALTDLRLTNAEQDIRELRHGRGYVQHEVNGEYPR